VTDLSPATATSLRRFGRILVADDGWLTIAGIDREAIPDAVAAIVAAGGRVHTVDAGRASLEDRYMELVAGIGTGAAPDAVIAPSPP
jgi:hypothetical protein